jgi:release factor glutamine methyltransferase
METNLTVGVLLTEGLRRLHQGANASSASLDAEVLLAHALAMSRAQIRAHPQNVPAAERARRYGELLERCASGEPVAYILGQREFWSLPIAVNPSVLIPRPETELLVERALALRPDPTGRILELGTGSGAIALALASERADWTITATDLSPTAIATARRNSETLGLQRIGFLTGDWFEPVAGHRFDLILSNPPYVADEDPALRRAPLEHEPHLALAGGADGLNCLRALVRQAPGYLERRGWLLLEHGFDQADAVARELVVRGFCHVRSQRDLAGHERVTEAQWV